MKDQYVGDLADFAKLGLLRRLAGAGGEPVLRPGVVWYLTADDGRSDGRHIHYLSAPRPNPYTAADPHLFGRLRRVVHRLGRAVRHLTAAGALPARAVSHAAPLSFAGLAPHRAGDRLSYRDAWLADALRATARCGLVLLDPDNGLAPPGVRRHTGAGLRYAYPEELRPFAARGQAVVVTQFYRRCGPHADQVLARLGEVRAALPAGAPAPFALCWRSLINLALLVAPASPGQAELLRERVRGLLDSPWGRFFTPPVERELPSMQAGARIGPGARVSPGPRPRPGPLAVDPS